MDIIRIFTRKNIEILELLSKENLHIRDIAHKLEISPAKVHSTIQLFKKYSLINENKEKNKIIINLNKKNKLLIGILNLLDVDNEDVSFEPKINIFDAISPLDFRYYGRNEKIFQKLQPYLSENAMIKYMLKVEVALTKILAKNKICSNKIYDEIQNASKKVTAEEVYLEEDKLKHNIRALVNCIRSKVSDEAKPFIHFTATSQDIISTADALRYKDFTNRILIPELVNFEKTLIDLALREKDTLQIGRTHGQHAVPITFGFAITNYVSRFGNSILKIRKTADNLRGKVAGAVGSYNASSLFFDNPEEFESQVLAELNLKPSPISTQIPEAEFVVDYVNAVIGSFGVLANLADDMRNLQRSEIAEVGEVFAAKQVGSSTMPQKRNPINFENVKSLWKQFLPRMLTVYMDQISEHQRDLTNSASSRFIPEILAAYYISVVRLNRTMSTLIVDRKSLKKNFDMNKGLIVAEPLYILLAAHNHPDAHEITRQLTLKAQLTKKPLTEIIKKEKSLQKYLKDFTKEQLKIIDDPKNYVGIANKKTESVCQHWKTKFKL